MGGDRDRQRVEKEADEIKWVGPELIKCVLRKMRSPILFHRRGMQHLLPTLNEEWFAELAACEPFLRVTIYGHEPILVVNDDRPLLLLGGGDHFVGFSNILHEWFLAKHMRLMSQSEEAQFPVGSWRRRNDNYIWRFLIQERLWVRIEGANAKLPSDSHSPFSVGLARSHNRYVR